MLRFRPVWLVGSGAMAMVVAAAAVAIAIGVSGDTTADLVLGQPDFIHTLRNFVDSKGLWGPSAVTIDSAGHVYVADTENNRVLGWASASALSNGSPADLVVGQSGFSDTGGGACLVPTTADSFCLPSGVAADSQGNLYVVDRGDSRVLAFANPFAGCAVKPCVVGNAEAVFGQPDFTSIKPNQGGGPTAQSLNDPFGVAVDGADNLFIADGENSRVLEFRQPLTSLAHCDNIFPCTDVAADIVYGQADFTSNSTAALGGPGGVWVDSSSNVYVADGGKSRIVEYNAPSGNNPAPSTIFQLPDSHGGLSDLQPLAVAVDPAGNVYTTDQLHQRIVEFNQPLTSPAHCNNTFPCTVESADSVFGQTSSSSGCNQGGASPTSQDLCNPMGLGIDSAGDVYVADYGNNRVLAYHAPLIAAGECNGSFPCYGIPANLVLGQVDFIYNTANLVDLAGLYAPNAVAVDSMNHVYVADMLNSRVLGWANAASLANGAPADLVIGQPSFYSSVLAPPGPGGACTASTTGSTLCGPAGLTVDTAGNLYVADTFESRVLEYDTPFAGCASLPCVGQPAHMIVGQSGTGGNKCNQGSGTPGPGTLCFPWDVAVDGAGNLYISDDENSRVVEYNNPLGACGAGQCIAGAANLIFGPNSSGVSCTDPPTSASLCFPTALALDSAGDLFVDDNFDNRVLEYFQPLAKTRGNGLGDTIADKVWGQNGSFTTSLCNLGTNTPSASSLCDPSGVAVDSALDVFIADGNFFNSSNNRVLEYNHKNKTTGPTIATLVFGQPDFTSGTCTRPASANTLCGTGGISIDGVGNLWVTDASNNRVLEYLQPLLPKK